MDNRLWRNSWKLQLGGEETRKSLKFQLAKLLTIYPFNLVSCHLKHSTFPLGFSSLVELGYLLFFCVLCLNLNVLLGYKCRGCRQKREREREKRTRSEKQTKPWSGIAFLVWEVELWVRECDVP